MHSLLWEKTCLHMLTYLIEALLVSVLMPYRSLFLKVCEKFGRIIEMEKMEGRTNSTKMPGDTQLIMPKWFPLLRLPQPPPKWELNVIFFVVFPVTRKWCNFGKKKLKTKSSHN